MTSSVAWLVAGWREGGANCRTTKAIEASSSRAPFVSLSSDAYVSVAMFLRRWAGG